MLGDWVARHRNIEHLPALMHLRFSSIQGCAARAVPRHRMLYNYIRVAYAFKCFTQVPGLSTRVFTGRFAQRAGLLPQPIT